MEGEATQVSAAISAAEFAPAQQADFGLALRAANRDPETWSRLFDQHFGAIYAYVRSRVHHAEEAEDLASQVFEIAFRRADSFDYRGVPVEGWLFGIARNLVRDHAKRSARRGASVEFSDASHPAEPDTAFRLDHRHDLREAMASLTEDQQLVVTLRFMLDRSTSDTARVMNRSEDAIKNLQRRALASLKRRLHSPGYPGKEDTGAGS